MTPVNDPDYNATKQARYRERKRALEATDPVASFVRAAIVTGLATLEKSRPDVVAQRTFSDYRLDLILRAAVSPASVSNTPALTQVTVAILDALVPTSAAVDLFQRGVSLNFNGAAQILVPSIAIPTASFVAEGAPIPVRQAPTSPGPTLSPHKLATITALTGEMIRSVNAETLVRQVLVESTGPALDAAVFSVSAATASQPAGLLNGITPLTPAAAGQSKSEILVDDLQKIATALGPVSGNGGIVLIGSPDTAAALKMRLPSNVEWPVLTTNSLAAKTVVGVAAAAVVSAIQGVPVIDASTESEIHYSDTPGEIVDVGGVRAAPVGSLFQTDNVGLRLKWPISWALRDSRGIAYMLNVNW
jgi:HK97 family phage major capsid protein